MQKYLLTYLDEKGIDLDTAITVESENGTENHMTVRTIVEFILGAPPGAQKKIMRKLILIDYLNGDVMEFLRYIAKFIAADLPKQNRLIRSPNGEIVTSNR